jgi:hypothetical protein
MCTPDTHTIDRIITTEPITITIPDGSTMRSTHEGFLDIPELPREATRVHVVPELNTHSLLSLGQLCNAGCEAVVTSNKIEVTYKKKHVLTGHRSPTTTLWHLEYPLIHDAEITPVYANKAIGTNTPANIVAFMHAAFFSPALDTLHKALKKGYITNIAGFTAETLKKYPPQSIAMVKGHLDQTRKNIRSTKTTNTNEETIDDTFPFQLMETDQAHANSCYTTIFAPTGTMYSDQTGVFVQPSSKGNNLLTPYLRNQSEIEKLRQF